MSDRYTGGRVSVVDYFDRPATLRPNELVYGVVREPPAPRYGHQIVVTHLGALLDRHVRDHDLGEVCVSPVDVVLDAGKALVLQPDIVFLTAGHKRLVDGRLWGAPDLVVEVLSPGTAQRDRTTKLRWYREHGVREYWLVDPQSASVEVVDLTGRRTRRHTFAGRSRMRSTVLPEWTATTAEIFE
jgi:Uma2 family endonuclease